jgi:hypothetical protein
MPLCAGKRGAPVFDVISHCRSCGATGLSPILSLGETPLVDALLKGEQLTQPEEKYPLTVVFCTTCSLMQILETVSPETLFCQDYPYYSSFSPALLAHSRENALRLIASQQLTTDSLVVELASNDGYMLRNFVDHGVAVLGIDPAEGPAKAAEQAGIPTLCTFFGQPLAQRLKNEGKQADVIIANNVLAHVPDLNGFVEGIGILLKPRAWRSSKYHMSKISSSIASLTPFIMSIIAISPLPPWLPSSGATVSHCSTSNTTLSTAGPYDSILASSSRWLHLYSRISQTKSAVRSPTSVTTRALPAEYRASRPPSLKCCGVSRRRGKR